MQWDEMTKAQQERYRLICERVFPNESDVPLSVVYVRFGELGDCVELTEAQRAYGLTLVPTAKTPGRVRREG